MNSKEIIGKITEALDEKKAIDIRVLDIGEISDFADYFIICSAANPNQLKTLVETVEETLDKNGEHEYNVEGRNDSGWTLIDCMDVIIHVFSKDQREFYDLEHMWQDGSYVDIEKFLPNRG